MKKIYMSVNIHWYPGHMTKAFRIIEENLKLVDACVELRDARIPLSSANPKIDEIIKNKPRVILLNKADTADSSSTLAWVQYFKTKNIIAYPIEAVTGKGLKQMQKALHDVTEQKRANYLAKGIKSFTVRAMIIGIPNVGKSTLINTLNKGKAAKTGDKAGVTRGKQWIKVAKDLELLDLPGVLWPKIEDQTGAQYLAFTGCINDDAIDKPAMIAELAKYLSVNYPERLSDRYKVDVNLLIFAGDEPNGEKIIEEIARNRGLILSGNRVDINRAGEMLLNEFRGGKLGCFTLDKIPVSEE
ncbi:MAG: ribosome biogenesis GTPase YlqF [Negativicutes bacterium]